MKIGEECKRMRIRAGLTNADVLSYLKIPGQTIVGWEADETPSYPKYLYLNALSVFGEVVGNASDHPELVERLAEDMKREHIESHKRFCVFKITGGVLHYRISFDRFTEKFRKILDNIRNANIRDLPMTYAVIDTKDGSIGKKEIRKSKNNINNIIKNKLDSRLYK